MFNGIPGLDDAVQSLGMQYREYNQGKVFFLRSAEWAKQTRNDHPRGSELIRCLANRMGTEARERLARTGKPTLIKCAIPLTWLREDAASTVPDGYAAEVIAQLIQRRRQPDEVFRGCMGGFAIARAISPANILEFMDMTGQMGDKWDLR